MDINSKVCEIIASIVGIEAKEINESDALIADLGFESLTLVELLIEVEDSFDITLDESDLDPLKLESTDDIIKLVEKYKDKGGTVDEKTS